MKSALLICSIFFLHKQLFAQDTVTIHHTWYTTCFDNQKHIPYLVQYTLTGDMLSCDSPIKRTNRFKTDPLDAEASNLNNDYKGSGYDRGHNMSAEDNKCDATGLKECFYFTNMFPQTHHLNAGVWKTVETMERQYALVEGEIYVYIGSKGIKTTIGSDAVAVPDSCWKVIYHYKTGAWEGYIFPNDNEAGKDPAPYMIPNETLFDRIGMTLH